MNRWLVIGLFTLGFLPGWSSAVEIKNIRPCYGPGGATRFEAKCLPGDTLWMSYDIDGLVANPKTGRVNYTTTLELLDANGASLFTDGPRPHEAVPNLGGSQMPGDLHVTVGAKRSPGMYTIRLTVRDKNGQAANDKEFKYKYEVVKQAFGFVEVSAPAVGVVGQQYVMGLGIVNFKLDAKGNPNAELTIRILDQKNKPVVEPLKVVYPRDLDPKIDLKEANAVPFVNPIFLNRTGRFTIELIGHDKNSGAKVHLSYPLTVLDIGTFGK